MEDQQGMSTSANRPQPDPTTHTRTIEIPHEVHQQLAEYAEAAGVSVDSVIAEAIDDFVTVCIPARLQAKGATHA